MPRTNDRRIRPTRFRIEGIFGSSPKAGRKLYDLLATKHANAQVSVRRLIFDFKKQSPADLVGSADDRHLPSGNTYVPAEKPQGQVSLDQAIQEGLMQPTSGSNGQTQVPDNDGAGGIPREGYERARLNAKELRKTLDQYLQEAIEYEVRLAPAQRGEDINHQNVRVPLHIIASTVGGMGSGSLVWFVVEGIGPCVETTGVEAKIVPELISLGNLSTHDNHLARLNEYCIFKAMRALATGACVNPVTGRVQPAPFDHVRLFSNRNSSGSIPSLKGLVHHQAWFHHFTWDTPGGADMQEREPDIGHWGYGAFEDPLCGYTASVACIHWNKTRLLDSLTYRASEILAQKFLNEGDSDQAIRDAASLAAAANLIESEDENQLTNAVSHPEALAGQPVYAAAEQSLIDQVAGTKGIERGDQLCEKIPLIRDEVRSIYAPQMGDKAQEIVEAAKDTLNRRLDQTLQQPQGLSNAIMILQSMESIVERSNEAIAVKISEIQEFLVSHDQASAEAAEQLQERAEQGRVRRSIGFQAVRAINTVLEESGRATINYELQIAACTAAVEYVLGPLRGFIQGKLAELLSARQSLLELVPYCINMARHKANERTVHDPAVGLELVSAEYADAYFADYLARNGGTQSVADQLWGLFLQEHGGLNVLLGASSTQMEASLLDVCRSVFESSLENSNALAEFQRVYPDERIQLDILAELVRECEGRLRIEGEIGKDIAYIKTANVPAEHQAEWMRRTLDNIDPKGGKWQVAVNPAEPETFSMAQLRGEISLTQFINRLRIEDDYHTWSQLVGHAADPISAIGVGPNPTPHELRRLVAKAIAAGLLAIDTTDTVVFHSHTGEEWQLGTEPETVWKGLRPHFRQLVFIESHFASQLVDSQPQIVATLTEMKTQLQGSSGDKLLSLTDTTALHECLEQAELLRPWAKQTHKRRKRARI